MWKILVVELLTAKVDFGSYCNGQGGVPWLDGSPQPNIHFPSLIDYKDELKDSF